MEDTTIYHDITVSWERYSLLQITSLACTMHCNFWITTSIEALEAQTKPKGIFIRNVRRGTFPSVSINGRALDATD